MSKSDILQELPKLERGDRQEILDKIWEMEEADLLAGAGPDTQEKALLDREWKDLQSDPNVGSEWKDVHARLNRRRETYC